MESPITRLAGSARPVPEGGANLPVTSCDDDGSAGTLREVLASAQEGDTIDLSQLACATVTLQQGQLATPLDDVRLVGPADHVLTLDAGGASRVLEHTGVGTLGLSHLYLRNGYISGRVFGACINSSGHVAADHTQFFLCINHFDDTGAFVGGGGIAAMSVDLSDSVISGCDGGLGGGGIYAYYPGDVTITRSTITSNIARHGGGVSSAYGVLRVVDSTISSNVASASSGGGLMSGGAAEIINSTISGNIAVAHAGGLDSTDSALVRNSTIAFNSATEGGGVHTGNVTVLTFESSIVASNTANNGTGDVAGRPVSGFGNIIMQTTMPVPADTLTGDPGLAPLADNGGPTFTHAFTAGSIAIDAGANPDGLPTDQRGLPRTSGAATDIGAFEWQDDRIFEDGFDPG